MANQASKQPEADLYKILFTIGWFLLGIAILFFLASSDKSFFKKPILRKIDNLSLISASTQKFIKNLPQIFHNDINLRVIILEDDKGDIRGGMYNSTKISNNEYNELLEHYRQAIKNKKKISEDQNMIIHNTLFQEKVYLHFDELTGFFSLLSFIANTNWINWTIFTVYLGLGFFLLGVFFHTSEVELKSEIETESIEKINESFESIAGNAKSNQSKFYQTEGTSLSDIQQPYTKMLKENNHVIQQSHLCAIPMFESQIKFILSQLSKLIVCPEISFFTYESKDWKPYIQKHGVIIVKGDFHIPPVVNSARKEINAIHNTSSSMMITVGTEKETLGLFFFDFQKKYFLSAESRHSILKLISNSANSLSIQRKFEHSTIDEETLLYTFPYLFMQLNNKIENKSIFTTLVLEILNFSNVATNTLRAWGQGVLHKIQTELNKNSEEDHQLLAARFSQERFAFVVNSDAKINTLLTRIAKEIENFSPDVEACSCIIPSMHKIQRAEDYFRIAEQLIVIAKRSRQDKVGRVA